MVYDGQFGSQTTVGSNICDAEGKSFEVMKFSVNVHVPQTLPLIVPPSDQKWKVLCF